MNLNLNKIAEWVQGNINSAIEDVIISGVNTDSRTIFKGDLFIPLTGERFDGHEFIKVAEEKGAAAAFWQKDKPIPDEVKIPLVLVSDSLKALQSFSMLYREMINPIIVGITGSNGKTTTKDLIASVLATKYCVHKTKGNLNNHIGVPLTLLSMPDNTEIAVVEMGMSNLGEIDLLSKLAKPDIVVITNIGESHLEFLKTRENIARAKLEILHGLKDHGWVILNGDEPLLRKLTKGHNNFNFVWVGKKESNDLFPVKIEIKDTEGINFNTNNRERYYLPLLGEHNVINALMAIKVGEILNVSSEDIVSGLTNLVLTRMRLEKIIAKNGSTIINDAYNASPTSMKASLKLLTSFDKFKQRIAILGDILELGVYAKEFHYDIGKFCANSNLSYLITTGELGKWIAESAVENGMSTDKVYYFSNKEQISDFIFTVSDKDTVILVKGSRGIELEKVVDGLV